MIKIYDGGYNAPLIEGMKAVNCGAHFNINGKVFEVMSKDFSRHEYNIVSRYIRIYGENYEKVEISASLKNFNNYNEMTYVVSYYKQASSNQSYRSTNIVSKKWEMYLNDLRKVHRTLFNGKVK